MQLTLSCFVDEKSGPRLEDFKKSRVHAAVVLRHGTTIGARVMGESLVMSNVCDAEKNSKAYAGTLLCLCRS